MSANRVGALEDLEIFTPLGLRFWDSALDRPIDQGLRVTAYPWLQPELRTQSVRNRSGVHSFRWLPGMRRFEYHPGGVDGAVIAALGRRAFVVTVEDEREHFLPAAFRVDLPLPYRGVFLAESNASVPDGSRRGIYLFSAPTRRVDERLTAVRGTLVDASSRAPAPWAQVIVRAPHGQVFHGLADERGRFVVMFPYPSLAQGFGGSPATFGHGTPIGARGWDLTVEVRSQPAVLGTLPATVLPEYRTVFEQAEVELWTAAPNPSAAPTPRLSLHLPFGQQLTVRTHPLSEQLVSAASEP